MPTLRVSGNVPLGNASSIFTSGRLDSLAAINPVMLADQDPGINFADFGLDPEQIASADVTIDLSRDNRKAKGSAVLNSRAKESAASCGPRPCDQDASTRVAATTELPNLVVPLSHIAAYVGCSDQPLGDDDNMLTRRRLLMFAAISADWITSSRLHLGITSALTWVLSTGRWSDDADWRDDTTWVD
jgi:hypothetical protein